MVPAETVLEMATINGAKAMGLEDQIGSIEAGKRADFIVIDMDAPHLTPAWDPVSTIAYAATGADVDTVVIDGKIVMEHRQVRTLDEQAILEEVRARYRAVGERGGLQIGPTLADDLAGLPRRNAGLRGCPIYASRSSLKNRLLNLGCTVSSTYVTRRLSETAASRRRADSNSWRAPAPAAFPTCS